MSERRELSRSDKEKNILDRLFLYFKAENKNRFLFLICSRFINCSHLHFDDPKFNSSELMKDISNVSS